MNEHYFTLDGQGIQEDRECRLRHHAGFLTVSILDEDGEWMEGDCMFAGDSPLDLGGIVDTFSIFRPVTFSEEADNLIAQQGDGGLEGL